MTIVSWLNVKPCCQWRVSITPRFSQSLRFKTSQQQCRHFFPHKAPSRATIHTSILAHKNPNSLEDTPAEGPRIIILIAFNQSDAQTVYSSFSQMDPDNLKVAICPPSISENTSITLSQAIDTLLSSPPTTTTPPSSSATSCPVVFFSGMSGQEIAAIVENWSILTNGAVVIPTPAFAAYTSKIAEKPLRQLITSVVSETLGNQQKQQQDNDKNNDSSSLSVAKDKGDVQDFYLVDKSGKKLTSSMGLGSLKEQLQEKVAQRRAAKAVEEGKMKEKKRRQAEDEMDVLRSSLNKVKKKSEKKKGFA